MSISILNGNHLCDCYGLFASRQHRLVHKLITRYHYALSKYILLKSSYAREVASAVIQVRLTTLCFHPRLSTVTFVITKGALSYLASFSKGKMICLVTLLNNINLFLILIFSICQFSVVPTAIESEVADGKAACTTLIFA